MSDTAVEKQTETLLPHRVKSSTVRVVIKAGDVNRVSKTSCDMIRDRVTAQIKNIIARSLYIMKKMDRITLTEEHIGLSMLLEEKIQPNAVAAIEILSKIYTAHKSANKDSESPVRAKKTPKRKTPGRRVPDRENISTRKKSKLNQVITDSIELQKLGVIGRVPLSAMKHLWASSTEDQIFFAEPRISKRALFALRSVFEVLITEVASGGIRYVDGRATLSTKAVSLYLKRNNTPGVHIRE